MYQPGVMNVFKTRQWFNPPATSGLFILYDNF